MTDRRPADPVVDEKGNRLGSYAEVARQINERYPAQNRRRPVSRQLVHKWFQYRYHNRFPAPKEYRGSANGDGNPMFDIKEVLDWYADRRQYRIDQDTTAPGITGGIRSSSIIAA